jgi:hypothetical protein
MEKVRRLMCGEGRWRPAISRNADRPSTAETRTVHLQQKRGPSIYSRNADRLSSAETRTVYLQQKRGPSIYARAPRWRPAITKMGDASVEEALDGRAAFLL